MGDAGIPDMSIHSDLPTVLAKVEERFRLDLTGKIYVYYSVSLLLPLPLHVCKVTYIYHIYHIKLFVNI